MIGQMMTNAELQIIVASLEEQLEQRSDASSDALEQLWQDIIIAEFPDYGAWEYPGQAYRHIYDQYNQVKGERDEALKRVAELEAAQTAKDEQLE
jgi:hypothetical protein